MTRAEIEKKIDNLYARLDNIEECKDNEAYVNEAIRIRDMISRLRCIIPEDEEEEV